MSVANFKYRDSSGNIKEGTLSLEDYRIAADHNMRTSAVVNSRHSDADPQFGSAFEQGAKYLGIFAKGDRRHGIMPTTVKAILDGTCTHQMAGYQLAGGSSIVSPKAPIGNSNTATRLFFPEIVLATIEETLYGDYSQEQAAYNRMFALNTSISGDVYTQPKIDTSAPRAQDPRSIAQNAMPETMVSITASQTSQALGAVSVGLQISDQAMRDATIDLVSMVIMQQAEGAKQRLLWRDLNRVAIGNPDAGESALTPVSFKTAYDSTAAAGTITHEGYLRMLWQPDRIYSFNMMFGPLEGYLAIEKRTGRPLMYDPATATTNMGNEGSYGLNPGNPRLINFTSANPEYLVVPDGVLSANQVCLLDTRAALMRVSNVSANYAAQEQMVLQRSNVFRFDMSFFVTRLREEALLLVDYSNA